MGNAWRLYVVWGDAPIAPMGEVVVLNFRGIGRGQVSDPSKPGVAVFSRNRALAFAKLLQIIGNCQVGDELHVLVADLTRQPYPKGAAVGDWQIVAIHGITQKRLRMQRFIEIDAVPTIGLERIIDDV